MDAKYNGFSTVMLSWKYKQRKNNIVTEILQDKKMAYAANVPRGSSGINTALKDKIDGERVKGRPKMNE